MDTEITRRAQVSLFVIVGIIIVVSIILFVIFRGEGPRIPIGQEFDPKRFVERCVRDSVEEKTDLILKQGGIYAPEDYILYENTKVPYLCKNINYYEPCINQNPLYLKNAENELRKSTESDIKGCFDSLRAELEERKYEFVVEQEQNDFEVKPGNVRAMISLKANIAKNDVTQNFDEIEVSIRSPLYDMAFIAQEIISQEAQYCYFEYVGYSLLYPSFTIDVTNFADSSKIYSIKKTDSQEVMRLATRGCALPAGF